MKFKIESELELILMSNFNSNQNPNYLVYKIRGNRYVNDIIIAFLINIIIISNYV